MASDIRTELKLVDVSKSEDTLWDEFVAKSPQGSVFQSTSWINLIAQSFKVSPTRLFCLRNDQPVGGLLFFETKKIFWKVATPTPLAPFTSPLLYAPEDEKTHKRISNCLNISTTFAYYMNKNLDFWILDTPYTFSDPRAFQWQGANIQPRHTYVVDLKNKENIIKNYNQSTRKKIKSAEQEDYDLFESNDPSHLINLISKSYHRHNRNPLIEDKNLTRFMKSAIMLPNVKLFYVAAQGEIKSARLIVEDIHTIYDLLAGSDEHTGSASVYLVNHLLTKYCQSHQNFDFMGADHPDIEQFKRGFGGELRQGFRISGRVGFPLSLLVKLNEYRLNKMREL
jgi:hypothetical protein